MRFRILDTISARLIKSNLSLNLSRCLMISIAGAAVKAVQSKTVANRPVMARIDRFIGKLWLCGTVTEMTDTLRKLLAFTSECIGISDKTSINNLLDNIMTCVHENYTDPSFNVSRLADLLSMNLSYISNFFKNNAGIGLNAYINQVRINRAKELLDLNNNIIDIVHQVGFENMSSFFRVFKKFVGTTPGAYKVK